MSKSTFGVEMFGAGITYYFIGGEVNIVAIL